MGAKLEVLHRLLVDVGSADNAEASKVRGKRNRTLDSGAGALGGLDDFLGRLVDDAVIVGAKPNANFKSCHVSFLNPPKNRSSAKRPQPQAGLKDTRRIKFQNLFVGNKDMEIPADMRLVVARESMFGSESAFGRFRDDSRYNVRPWDGSPGPEGTDAAEVRNLLETLMFLLDRREWAALRHLFVAEPKLVTETRNGTLVHRSIDEWRYLDSYFRVRHYTGPFDISIEGSCATARFSVFSEHRGVSALGLTTDSLSATVAVRLEQRNRRWKVESFSVAPNFETDRRNHVS